MENVLRIHNGDPNFPYITLQNIKEFLGTFSSEFIDFSRLMADKTQATLLLWRTPRSMSVLCRR